MSVVQGYYFDGRYALRHKVGVLLADGRLKVVGTDVDGTFDARQVRVSPRIANTPRWLYLPDGGACVVGDNDFVDRLTRESALERTLHKWESRPAYAALAVALVGLGLWLMIDRGLPIVVDRVAEQIPLTAETALGRQTLAGMDRYLLKASELSLARQKMLRVKFGQMAQVGDPIAPPRLEFRSSPDIGPNAFALPSGIVVITDELVTLAHSDREILAVLAHELGHVRHRHTMRRLLRSSAIALIIAAVTGDIAATTSIAAAAPAVLLQGKYSRDNEREADQYALDLLQRSNIEPRYFSSILQRMEESAPRRGTLPSFLSSHPATEERKALALKAAGVHAEADDAQDAEEQQKADSATSRLTLAALEPEQRKIIELLERRDYEELERTLGAYQLAFEQDPKTSVKLEIAFRSFTKVPRNLESHLNEWVAKKPASYAAFAARGGYYVSRGQDARGTAYTNSTSQANIQQMQAYFRTASSDLDHSLTLTPKPYISHRSLLTIARSYGTRDEQRSQYQQAIRWAPQSVETRLAYMTSLEPRWGGTYEQMEAFVSEARAVLQDPKDVNRLAARIPAYRGFEAQRAQDYPRALTQFDEAIKLDANASTLCDRAHVLNELKRYDEALKDVSRALALDGNERYCVGMAVHLAARATDANEVIRLMGVVIAADPSSASALSQRGWRYTAMGKPDLAFQDYLDAAKLGDAWAQMQVAKLYWQGLGVQENREEGVVWLRKAAEQGDPDAKLSLQQALSQLERK